MAKVVQMVAEPIRPEAYAKILADPRCGAHCNFEGRVRDHQDGKTVVRLDYEAYPPMATVELQRIADEACQRFEITHLVAVHRYGHIPIGELAVYIGVAAGHRAPAFDACRYVIEEVKKRLPVWKHETYTGAEPA
jgi:molybdopterin synthase catalytic subunit